MRTRIKEFREQRGMTIDQLSEKTDISKVTLFRIERGMNNPNMEALAKIAEALGCSMADLLTAPTPLPVGENVIRFSNRRQ